MNCWNCLQILDCTQEEREGILATIASVEDGQHIAFDYNRVIPMPVAFLDWETDRYDRAERRYQQDVLDGKRGIAITLGPRDLPEMKLYGRTGDWYRWRVANWGTKANAIEPRLSLREKEKETVLLFQSVWQPPLPVIAMLSQKNPKYTFRTSYVDPDGQSGECTMRGGRAEGHKETLWPRDSPQCKAVRELVQYPLQEDSQENRLS